MPSIEGSASGLRNTACNINPHTDNAQPAKRAVKERTITQMGIAKCYTDRYNILVAQFICCAGARNTCAGVQELEPLAHCYVSYLLTLV